MCFKVGDGWSINFWEDLCVRWLEGNISKIKERAMIGGDLEFEFITLHSRSWSVEVLQSFFDPKVIMTNCKIELPRCSLQNKLTWIGNSKGNFTVESCYEILTNDL